MFLFGFWMFHEVLVFYVFCVLFSFSGVSFCLGDIFGLFFFCVFDVFSCFMSLF